MKPYISATELSALLTKKEVSAREAVSYYADRIAQYDRTINSFITTDIETALVAASDIDDRRARNETLSPLAGVPFGVKDALDTAQLRSTGASAILDTYVPPFDATTVARLRNAGAIILGKQNCDAFGHGASNENSMYGPVANPWDTSRVAGGSSGGSAASIAADFSAFSIGEDTGGSIRAPASFCGVTGLKVSYGRTSRFGAMPMASSLDTVGPFGHSVADVALVLEHIAGHDPLDPTTATIPVPHYTKELNTSLVGKKIGVPREYMTDDLDPAIRAHVRRALDTFVSLGAELVDISLPHTAYAIATYYVLVPCEDSSNLGRIDGIRYGVRKQADDLYHTYTGSRTVGFPEEVKRRIMIGTFALSHGYYDAYYLKAQKVRTLIIRDFDAAFKNVDVIITPTTPEVAFPLGAKTVDPLKMYLSDAFVSPASLAGLPALSIPCGFESGLPVGLQIIGPRLREEIPLAFGHQFQQVTTHHLQHPVL